MRPFKTSPTTKYSSASDFVIFHQYLKVHKLIIRIDYLHHHAAVNHGLCLEKQQNAAP